MSDRLVAPAEVVLVDDGVSPEFDGAVRSLGSEWTSPSGRRYLLDVSGRRLTVSWPASATLSSAPPGGEVDEDLASLGHAIYQAMGGEWAGVGIDKLADVWTGAGRDRSAT